VVIWGHDDQAYWAVIGGIVNGICSKMLKRAFDQQRPSSARGLRTDPGMPSSHAQWLAFFSLYASLSRNSADTRRSLVKNIFVQSV
jgi:membrane-associated phospholipid phosphatase